jgi:hypothetical protein
MVAGRIVGNRHSDFPPSLTSTRVFFARNISSIVPVMAQLAMFHARDAQGKDGGFPADIPHELG